MFYSTPTPVYKAIAEAFVCSENAEQSQSPMMESYAEDCDFLRDILPSGSGIDGTQGRNGCRIESVTDSKIVISFGFHHMDDNGFYCGWTEHKCVVTASLRYGFELKITGPNKRNIKDYLGDLFYSVLNADVWQNMETKERCFGHKA